MLLSNNVIPILWVNTYGSGENQLMDNIYESSVWHLLMTSFKEIIAKPFLVMCSLECMYVVHLSMACVHLHVCALVYGMCAPACVLAETQRLHEVSFSVNLWLH